MAVAFDAVSSATPTKGTTSPNTWTHTGVGSALAVVAAICLDEATSSTTVSCTYNAVAMSLLGAIPAAGANNGYLYFFGITNQASGAKTVSFTFSGTTDVVVGASLSWTGAATGPAAFGGFQPSPLSGGEGSATSPSLLFKTTTAGAQVFAAIAAGNTITSMGGGAQRFLDNNTSGGDCGSIVGSNAAVPSPVANITFTSVISTSASYAFGGLEILPTPATIVTPGMEDTIGSHGTTASGQAIIAASCW